MFYFKHLGGYIIGVGTLFILGGLYYLLSSLSPSRRWWCTLLRDKPRLAYACARRVLDNYARIVHICAASVPSALDIGGAAEWTIKNWGGGGLQPPKPPWFRRLCIYVSLHYIKLLVNMPIPTLCRFIYSYWTALQLPNATQSTLVGVFVLKGKIYCTL